MKTLKKIIFKLREKKYSLTDIFKGHQASLYRGVPCQKSPFDYVIYQMILFELKPDLIIEIGTNYGGSTLYLADLLNIIGNGEIHSIDIKDDCSDIVKQHSRIKLFTDGWESYNLDLVKNHKTVLVIEDSSHQYENTLEVINHFSEIVTKESYLIVEDGIISDLGWDKSYSGGPRRAISEFLKQNQKYFIDRRWTDFYGSDVTFNPKGFLKRK